MGISLNKLTSKLAAHLVKLCISFVWSTSRIKATIDPESQKLMLADEPLIISLWHNRILLLPKFMQRFKSFASVVSSHRDGDLLSEFLMAYNHTAIRGSSRRGGFNAIKQVMQHLKDNKPVVITPDGPLGPRYSINGNITNIAIKSHSAIIPVCYSVKNAKVLKTWDNFIIPYPFNDIAIDVMKPIYLNNKLSEQEQKSHLQSTMMEQIKKLDQQISCSNRHSISDSAAIIVYNIYHLISSLLHPFLKGHLLRRVDNGKENLISIKQKMGIYELKRPEGKLVWVHAASVGESKSALPLINQLSKHHGTHVLLTTSTLTAAQFLNQEIKENSLIIHQFLVLDTPQNTKSFFKHWRPNLGIFIDSELWPNIIYKSSCPMMLINARISPDSFHYWRKISWMFRFVVNGFKTISPTTAQDIGFLKELGIDKQIHNLGNLKDAAPPLAYDIERYTKSKKALTGFNFVCASTHEGEEVEILKEFMDSKINIIIVPRHPNRSPSIAKMAEKIGYEVSIHSAHPIPFFKSKDKPHLYIVDKIGDLGLWYRIADIAFVGGSLVDIGGHNIIEATQLGKPVIVGPFTYNFSDSLNHLKKADAILQAKNATGIKKAVLSLSKNKNRLKELGKNAEKASAEDNRIISSHIDLILKVMNNDPLI